jgi:NAD(P)-dependent dehydrogenase (short-subunit alcohol dehydrogenase family)/acyl carrier protein
MMAPAANMMAPVVQPVKPIPVEIGAGAPMGGVVENAVVVIDIKGLLLKIVSDKTGYPSDMLDLDSDMEADLSIDSIKRMEIIAALKTQLGTHYNNEEDITERLASVKTLQGLINLIGGMESGPVEEAKKIIEEGFVHEKEETLVRLRFEPGVAGINRSRAELLMGKHFAITDDAGMVSVTLKKQLETYGAAATVISPQDNLEAYDGLILLDLSTSSDLSASRGRTNIHESFGLIKKLDMSRVRWVYAISMLRHFQGYPGFLKSLNKEWEETVCRAINLDSELSPEKIATLIVDELLTLDDQPEVYYHAESRKTMSLVPAELTIGHQADIRMDKSSVVLVLGGAQGITAELMIRFSKEYPCRLVLVGRSTDPRADDQSYDNLAGKEAIRDSLIHVGQLKNPAEIERKVEDLYKRKQIMNTIRALEKNGATVDYHSLDCRDEEKLSELIRGLYRQYGRIDGVVHGAGLLEDKLFRHKTKESFERVFSTKVNPLRALAAQLKADTQFVVLFSSVASVYGNRGQTDYAAANSVMDQYARELKKQISGKVLAINWGPWKGTGMVSPALEREYERRGISLIPLKAGMEVFLNELKYGNESQVLIMAGQAF